MKKSNNISKLIMFFSLLVSLTACGGGSKPTSVNHEGTKGLIFDENSVIDYEGTDTAVVIPSEYNGYTITNIGDGAFSDCTCVASIVIPDSVTSIGSYAFKSCTSLTSIVIPHSAISIGEDAFYDCYSLQFNVYDHCNYLGNSLNPYVALISYKTKQSTYNINSDCKFIYSDAFSNCDPLTSIVIPDSVTSIGLRAFIYCESLTSIVIPDSVTSIGDDAFSLCTSLQFNVYDHCNYLGNSLNPYVALISYKTKQSTYNINSDCKFIYSLAFSWHTSLTSIVIPDSVTSIGGSAFWKCTSLTSIDVDNNNQAFSSLDGILYNKNITELICYPGAKSGEVRIPDSVTSIGDGAFSWHTSLTSLVIPNSVTSIGFRAFFYCDSLMSIVIPDSVTSIGDAAFWKCTSLTSIVIPDSVTSIGEDAFSGCTSLISINVDNNNQAFSSLDGILYNKNITELICCPEAKSGEVRIPNSVTSIGRCAFCNCCSLTSIYIPDSVASIDYYAFEGCSSLTSIVIPDSVTSIGEGAFFQCTSLTSIVIPNSVTSIGDRAFFYCTSLQFNVYDNCNYLGNSLNPYVALISYKTKQSTYNINSNCKFICSTAFDDCFYLTSIVIPDSVTSIGKEAFDKCRFLTIYCEASSQPSGWDSNWNLDNPVYWAGEWEYDSNGNPTPIN